MTTLEKIFINHGCKRFWKPEYDYMPEPAMIEAVEAENVMALDNLIYSLKKRWQLIAGKAPTSA